ncbi:hypothetical protein N0V93_004719 [Gnomoniopsis smithogilvyi]|uniref:Uncharacterized protein n=1 Tax=Gnomoniopsis smithogilvyi TaxID=1191159 RepID=A0A9W8YRZ6_9PEZI|nr:hypothetical protein N0V93_004719 [Gnomoniopsis smithogilvyi]
MAAFSRGLGLGLTQHIFSLAPKTAKTTCLEPPLSILSHIVRRSTIPKVARSFQTSARLHASKQATQPKPNPRSHQPAPSKQHTRAEPAPSPQKTSSPALGKKQVAVQNAGLVASVANELAARGQPTILYQSPSHFWLRFSSLSAATFLISYAGINYYITIAHPQPGLQWWVPVAFSLVCLISACLGYLFLFSTTRIVRRITAIPTKSLPASYLKGGKKLTPTEGQALKALRASPIALECEVGGTLPLLGHRKLIAAPSNVELPFRFTQAPVSQASDGKSFGGPLYGLRRGLTSEGFSPIMINGKRCKIDVLSGKVLDGGKVLDVLMPYRPDKFSNTWLDRLLKR